MLLPHTNASPSGKLYIISAPSGAGKTSLVKQLVETLEDIVLSVSHTTRQQRPGEINGRDYFFVSVETFQGLLQQNAFLEYAQVFDNFYGTARSGVEQQLRSGKDVILEIDWQGAQQVRLLMPDSTSIFILPPSLQILEQRLRNRAQDSEETIRRRMRDAATETSHYREFDYLIVNDNFEQALQQLQGIIACNRLHRDRQQALLQPLLDELLSAVL
ncbi:MAG: guanylate kinase [Gammaproteobacteria bacterium]